MSAVRPLRVLLLNQYYPPDACSTGQHAADLGSALAARGHDVHVVCGSRAYGGGATRRVAEARIDGVAVHRVASTGLGRASLLHRVVDCGSLYPRLLQRARRIPSIDVCVALTMPPFVGMVGRALRLPLVLWVMDVFEEAVATFGVIREGGIAHRGSRAVARVVYDGATRVVSLGETMTERLVDLGVERGRLVEVHNWMPNEPARTVPVGASHARQRWELGPRPVLMYSGNLGLGHELETAVRAISQARRVVEFDTLFVGEGQMRPKVESLCRRMAIPGVRFLPPQPLPALADCLSAGDVHLVGQGQERLGVSVPSKLYGVLAVGRAALFIGPLESECARLVRDAGAGAAVRCGDVEGAAAALTWLFGASDEERLDLGCRARRYHDANLGRARSLARFTHLVEGVASERA